MDKILLVICNGLSCFIICTILFQFMNERYVSYMGMSNVWQCSGNKKSNESL